MVDKQYFRQVNDAALGQFDSVMGWLGLSEGKRSGGEWLARNPKRNDTSAGSFSINTATGAWSDFALSGVNGLDLVSLTKYVLDYDNQVKAADALADLLGLMPREGRSGPQNRATTNGRASGGVSVSTQQNKRASDGPQKPEPPKDTSVCPVPDDAPAPWEKHMSRGKPSVRYAYRAADGRVNFYHDRYEATKDGERKQFCPLSLWKSQDGKYRWQWKAPAEPRPIYGLDLLAARPDAACLVVEGEKARDAAELLVPDAVVVCWQGGAQAVAKADWTALAGRDVVLWPDADIPGVDCMNKLAVLAQAAGASSVHKICLARLALDPVTDDAGNCRLEAGAPLAQGDDAADLIARGWQPGHMAILWPRTLADDNGILFETMAADMKSGAQQGEPPVEKPPVIDGLPKRFVLNRDGLHTLSNNGDPLWFGAPLVVLARARDNASSAWGRLIEFHNGDGIPVRDVIPETMVAGDGAELEKYLRGNGYVLSPNGRQLIRQYIIECNPAARARTAAATGWHAVTGEPPVFILPDQFYGKSDEPWMYRAAGDQPKHYAQHGTLNEWRENVAAYCAGNSRLVFAVSAAFAGPLLFITGDQSGGFHLKGNSSDGKTTALVAAASVCGPHRDFVQRWRATDNSMESLATRYSDGLLPLDDLGQSDPKTLGDTIYMLANEAGRNRMTDVAGMRRTHKWRVMFMSTGEVSLADHMALAGKKPMAGQDLRMAEIPADAGRHMGVFESIHGATDPAAFSRMVVEASGKYFGTPLRAWVDVLARGDHVQIVEQIEAARRIFAASELSEGAHGQVHRTAQRFALVGAAGELATEFGITGWKKGEAISAAQRCFRDWLQLRGGDGEYEMTMMFRQIRAFMDLHQEGRFKDLDRMTDSHAPSKLNHAGWKEDAQGTEQGVNYYVSTSVWRNEVCKGFDPVRAARLMVEKGWAVAHKESQNRMPRYQITLKNGSTPKVIFITPAFMDADI